MWKFHLREKALCVKYVLIGHAHEVKRLREHRGEERCGGEERCDNTGR